MNDMMVDTLTNKELDDTDRLLLKMIQTKSDISNVELARIVNLSPPATHGRIKRLENEGYIKNYITVLDREKLGFDLLCFIYVKTSTHHTLQLAELEDAIVSMPEVLECHHITGEYDLLLKVVLRDSKDLKDFIGNKLSLHENISGIQTSLSYEEVKATTALPFPN